MVYWSTAITFLSLHNESLPTHQKPLSWPFLGNLRLSSLPQELSQGAELSPPGNLREKLANTGAAGTGGILHWDPVMEFG